MLEVIALTSKYAARSDMRFRTNEINDMKIVDCFLIIVNEIEELSDEIVIFSVYVVFEKSWDIATIEFEV